MRACIAAAVVWSLVCEESIAATRDCHSKSARGAVLSAMRSHLVLSCEGSRWR